MCSRSGTGSKLDAFVFGIWRSPRAATPALAGALRDSKLSWRSRGSATLRDGDSRSTERAVRVRGCADFVLGRSQCTEEPISW